MKYRIAEYQIPQPETGNKFFVEIGKLYKEKLTLWFYVSKTNWEFETGYKTMEEAVQRISELKKALPIYHVIK